jgi:hypothetical protein
MATASPTQRTMEWLRGLGYVVDKVERRLPRGFVTVDCFGFADILALHSDVHGVLAVQATTSAHVQERVQKVQAEPRATLWLRCGNRIWVVGWGLRVQEHRKRWIPRVIKVTETGTVEDESAILGQT